jgi:hypothetical protein
MTIPSRVELMHGEPWCEIAIATTIATMLLASTAGWWAYAGVLERVPKAISVAGLLFDIGGVMLLARGVLAPPDLGKLDL